MSRVFTIVLRAGIGAVIFFGLFGQIIVIPTTLADMEGLGLPRGPVNEIYTVVGILGVACVQVALVALWMLLAMVERDSIFSMRAFRWIDTIIGAALVATLLAFAMAAHLTFAPTRRADGMDMLSLWLFSIACVGVGVAFAMLMVVMRGLLRKATDLETEMAEVV
jgi:hypothetical protein